MTAAPEMHDDLAAMHVIHRKRLFRDILKEYAPVTIRDIAAHLELGPIEVAAYSQPYKLVRATVNRLVDDGLTIKHTSEQPYTFTLRTVQGSPLTYEERLFQQWEDRLADRHGWHRFTDLQTLTAETMQPIERKHVNPFITYVNDRDRIRMRKSNEAAGNGVRYFVDTCDQDRYTALKADVPDDTAHIIDEAVKVGRKPSVVAATIEWFLTDISQREAAEKYERTQPAIYNNRQWVFNQLQQVDTVDLVEQHGNAQIGGETQ